MRTPLGIELRVWSKLAAAVISVAVLAVVFRRLNLPELWKTLRQAHLGWLAAAHLLLLLGLFFSAIRWHLVLRLNGASVHSGVTLKLTMIGHFLNTLLFGAAGGDVAKSALYSRWYGRPMSSVLATCALDRLVGGVGFVLLVLLAPLLALAGNRTWDASLVPKPSLKLLLAAAAIVALVLTVVFLRDRLRKLPPVARFADAFHANLRQLFSSPALATRGTAYGFLAHLFGCSILLFCLKSVAQRPIPLLELIWVFPAISMIASVPVTFAGAGVREGSALVLLGMYGIEATDAVAAALLVSLIYLFWLVVGGLLLWRMARAIARQPARPASSTLSAVVPALNEAEVIEETIQRLQRIPEVAEIIVVDGGSTDGTQKIAQRLGCRVIESPRGRGQQMRRGAEAATGDVVWLVHADTWAPPEAGRAVLDCLRDPTVTGGGCWKSFREPSPLMLGSRFRCAVRLYLAGRVMGDQAIFARRDALKNIGGVPEMPLMEEFELCRRLRREGHLALAATTVTTSARRFAKRGVLRTYARMWRVTLQYYFGVPVQKLQRSYEKE